MKNKILKSFADMSIKSAKRASNCASILGLHQPKEPKNLKRNNDSKRN